MSNGTVEIIGRAGRRRWGLEEKLRIVAETHETGDKSTVEMEERKKPSDATTETLVAAERQRIIDRVLTYAALRDQAAVMLDKAASSPGPEKPSEGAADTIDVPGLLRTRPSSDDRRAPLLRCDVGEAGRWLRAAGYDAELRSGETDSQFIERCRAEERVLVSRSGRLARRLAGTLESAPTPSPRNRRGAGARSLGLALRIDWALHKPPLAASSTTWRCCRQARMLEAQGLCRRCAGDPGPEAAVR